MIFHNIEQNNDAWLDLRKGKVTSSSIAKVMANYGKSFGEPAKKYAVDIALEQITGKRTESGYSNSHMERGHEQEPLARIAYENEYFCDVLNGGFFDLGDFGCSPDGLVGDNGVIEIKSVIASVHYDTIRKASYPSAYQWQLKANLKATEREWIDFVSYCPDYPRESQLYVYRLYAEECQEDFKKIDARLAEFLELVAEVKKNILNQKQAS